MQATNDSNWLKSKLDGEILVEGEKKNNKICENNILKVSKKTR